MSQKNKDLIETIIVFVIVLFLGYKVYTSINSTYWLIGLVVFAVLYACYRFIIKKKKK